MPINRFLSEKRKLAEIITHYHLLSLVVIRCHSLSLAIPLVVTRCITRCHSLSLVVTRCITHLSFYKRSNILLYFDLLSCYKRQKEAEPHLQKDQARGQQVKIKTKTMIVQDKGERKK